MRILLPADRIQKRVAELAAAIQNDYRTKPITILAVLTGSLMFLADLVRQLDLSLRIALIQSSSYRGRSTQPGQLHVQEDLVPDLRGRHVLLLDDILDTGQTLKHLVALVQGMGVASLKVAVLLRKQGRQQHELEPDYCGFEIPDEFVVGYGLDFNDEFRHLPHVAALSSEEVKQP